MSTGKQRGRHGAKPGERRGGRAAGTPNKATIARERAAQAIADAGKAPIVLAPAKVDPEQAAIAVRAKKSKLAIDVLEEFMRVFAGMAARQQPRYDSDGKLIAGNPGEFERWARLTVVTADRLAPYQSPTFKALAVVAPPPQDQPNRPDLTREGNVVKLNDPVRAARVYAQIMKG